MKKGFGVLVFFILTASLFAKTMVIAEGSGLSEIQAAINSAKKGDVIVINSGFYETSDKIVVDGKSGITIRGEGQVDIVCNLLAHVIVIKNSDDIVVENLHMVHSIYMNSEYAECGETANVIQIENSNFITVRKCELNGCGYIGINSNDCPSITVKDNYIHSNTSTGIIIAMSVGHPVSVEISGNRIINNRTPIEFMGHYVYEDSNTKQLKMSGNIIYPKPALEW